MLVDDLQEVDEPSAAVLLSLVANGSIRLLATLREPSTPCDAVTALWKENLVERVDLPPFTRSQVAELLTATLAGPVASPTVETLWGLSTGNALYLTELLRYGIQQGHFARHSGSWWWTGGQDVSPRLAELLLARVTELSPAGVAAAEVLALGDPLPYETLDTVIEPGALDELERSGLVVSDDSTGVLLIRFSHPHLQSVTESSLTTTRRRSLSRLLRAAPSEQVDIVRQAVWEMAAGGRSRPEILLGAAEQVMLTDPGLAERMARRAADSGAGSLGLSVVSHIQAERGDTEAARSTLAYAFERVTDEEERFAVDGEDLSQQLWLLRDAAGAHGVIERMRATLSNDYRDYRDDLDTLDGLVLLFSGRTTEVIATARQVLERGPERSAEIRALSALMGGLCFADRGPEALAAADRLERAVVPARLPTTRLGLIQALLAITRLLHGPHRAASLRPAGALGRWPVATDELTVGTASGSADHAGWPLLVGIGRHIAGDLAGALGPLREAVVQQLAGEGVFRSEAVAELIVVACELGRRDEAEAVLMATPPDQVAMVPGLLDWARAAVAGPRGCVPTRLNSPSRPLGPPYGTGRH